MEQLSDLITSPDENIRNRSLDAACAAMSRDDLMSLTEECSRVTGIPYLMEAYRAEAEAILNS